MSGLLEVGLSVDGTEIIINHPDLQPDANGCGHIVFSPDQARALARILLKKANECGNLPYTLNTTKGATTSCESIDGTE